MSRSFQFESSRPVRGLDFFWFFFQGTRTGAKASLFAACLLAAQTLTAEGTNAPITAPPFPDTTGSLIRVFGALALVLGLFLAGAWLFKNWQRLSVTRGRQPKLNIVETRSLGARQAVFVVGYERQRFLVATSPTGVNLLSHLPDAEAAGADTDAPVETPAGPMPFGQALMRVLKRK
jgi:flagellar biogenesis protein FliO